MKEKKGFMSSKLYECIAHLCMKGLERSLVRFAAILTQRIAISGIRRDLALLLEDPICRESYHCYDRSRIRESYWTSSASPSFIGTFQLASILMG